MEFCQILNLMNQELIVSDGKYGPIKVMRSAVGYYLGREFIGNDGLIEPGSRESSYWKIKEEAEYALKEGFEWRDSEENVMLYQETKSN